MSNFLFLSAHKFDSVFFYGGEVSRLPFDSAFHDPQATPNDFTKRFVQLAKQFGSLAKVGPDVSDNFNINFNFMYPLRKSKEMVVIASIVNHFT